jgi:ribonuclease P protein component
MLTKKYRLPIQQFFKKTGKTIKSRYFLLKIFPTKLDYSRFGVIISSKISRKAVIRNRLKRTIFNYLKEKYRNLPIYDYLFILYPSAALAGKDEIINELIRIMKYEL